ncbi:hypothetical protein BDZ91DRAFT_802059 [Kalaharituber pfeilii]|nr:hypothetical protein BDZ91DRAFT_802059 [Kalaharituber pfeilii]
MSADMKSQRQDSPRAQQDSGLMTFSNQTIGVMVQDDGVLVRDHKGHELTTHMVSLGCARVSDLMELSGSRLAAFDYDLRELRDWMLTRATGVSEMYQGHFAGKLRALLNRYGIKYVDGSDDRRWNGDIRNEGLSIETRLRAALNNGRRRRSAKKSGTPKHY